jgi:hypothetical protein
VRHLSGYATYRELSCDIQSVPYTARAERKMNYTKALWMALWLALWLSATAMGQDEPSLNLRIVEALKAKEPEWKPISVIESGRIPVVSIEKRIVAAVWQNPKSHSEDVDVFVYGVANRIEAAAWLGPVRNRQLAPGWQVSAYQIGDEGYLAKYKHGGRFEIEFRSGVVVAKIAGNDPRMVKDFAKCIIHQIPANPNSR